MMNIEMHIKMILMQICVSKINAIARLRAIVVIHALLF